MKGCCLAKGSPAICLLVSLGQSARERQSRHLASVWPQVLVGGFGLDTGDPHAPREAESDLSASMPFIYPLTLPV